VRRGPGWLAAPLVLAMAACTPSTETSSAPASSTPSPFEDCAALSAPPPSAAPGSSSAASSGTLPELSLPCFTGGQQIALRALTGPAVINMWASWCGPCRDELPLVQELADKAGGRLHVLGVDVGDSREAAASFGEGRGVTMPTLYDRERRLPAALGKANLPVTVFVDAAGRAFVHPLPVDARELAELVRTHTGVTVAP
jgi:cytochrome c biogenesis protein CcmG/thiol:disulfide interchange protein DsbE